MTISLVLALLSSAGAAAGGAALGGAAAQPSIEVTGTRPSCVSVSAEARMQAYGFDHVVAVRNGCAQPVTCSVSTSVNSSPTVVQLGPGASQETLTWRGSPASVFTANVDCTTR